MTEYQLYLPIRAAISQMQIGILSSRTIEPNPPTYLLKPIVW